MPTGLVPQRRGKHVWIQQEIDRFRCAVDEHVRVKDHIHRAALAIVYRNTEASGGSDGFEEQAVIVSISERRNMRRVKFLHILALLDVLVAVFHDVNLYGKGAKGVARFGFLVCGQNVDIGKIRQLDQLIFEGTWDLSIAR
jgi:hypothetical protein